MNATLEGYLIEQQVAEKLLNLGYQVLRDILPQSRTDLWIRGEGERYIKIQVKKVRWDLLPSPQKLQEKIEFKEKQSIFWDQIDKDGQVVHYPIKKVANE